MSEPGRSHFSSRLILGIVAILIGTALLLENLNMLPSDQVFRWWPLLLLALAFGRFMDRGFIWGTGGHVLLWVGILGLLGESAHDEIIYRWWPMILVYFGLLVAIRSFVPRPPKHCKAEILNHSKEMQS
jgi:hypothetical protein